MNSHHIPRIIARPYGGTNTALNRKEYLLARVMEASLEQIARHVDVNAGSMREALSGFETARRTVTGAAFRKQINHYTGLTFKDGADNAVILLKKKGIKSAAIFAAPKKDQKNIPLLALPKINTKGTTTPMTKWGTIIDKLTDHTVDHFDRLTDDFKDRLKGTLKEGYTNGEGVPDLSKRVQDALGVDKTYADQFARTTTMEVYNQAHLAQYSEVGIPGIEILVQEDERTCDVCGDLDGTTFALDDPGLMYPPFHERCRCVASPVVDALPEDAGEVSEDTRAFYDAFDERFPVPNYALGEE